MVGDERQPGILTRGRHRLGGLFVLASPPRRPISRRKVTLVIKTQGLSKNFAGFAALVEMFITPTTMLMVLGK